MDEAARHGAERPDPRLKPGARLGPYEVQRLLGAGGMGEVYQARDTRLQRSVAVKVLPARLASQPELRKRFEREARNVSSLSHPHICALYDVGEQDGVSFLVMEYLEGETLAERLRSGPLPQADAVRHGIEIAEALAEAHERGLLHRDLKPANVMLPAAAPSCWTSGSRSCSRSRPGNGRSPRPARTMSPRPS